jgi:hypothetical protein
MTSRSKPETHPSKPLKQTLETADSRTASVDPRFGIPVGRGEIDSPDPLEGVE